MTNAVLSAGSKIGIGDGASPEVFNKIPEVLSMTTPETSRPTVDVTSLDSTAKEYISGLKDGGSIELSGNWVASNTYHQLLKTNASAGTAATFLITLPTSPVTAVEFTGTPEAFGFSVEPDSQITFSATLKVSGDPDWTTSATVTG